ncbi:ABC transporter ATP-binding protein [uncultured Roseobacter sp.]|uniref:ABC transporter ATP-binding protein n=1 Tax=uncultured Roseobacter sp. TaxID=114847 RepID=UPI002635D607|nr:ABC transporter ATP-binding protein [uncultured Roseobacter sp.]
MTRLYTANLSFAYGMRRILNDVTLAPLVAGKLTALIGPNASGKSTLFKVIAGLLRPVSGQVFLGDTDLADLGARDRLSRIRFMPQFFAANAALTVFDVVMMAQKQLQGWRVTSDDMNHVAKALQSGGIGHLADAYVSELSGGQSQMVSCVQALIRPADVYLFDEPTSALDLHHQLAVLSRIRSAVTTRGAVGIVALHDLNLAARFADHLILIGQGRLLAEGAPRDVLYSAELGEAYGVDITITKGPREDLTVHAYAP